jgi:hypothetical protein
MPAEDAAMEAGDEFEEEAGPEVVDGDMGEGEAEFGEEAMEPEEAPQMAQEELLSLMTTLEDLINGIKAEVAPEGMEDEAFGGEETPEEEAMEHGEMGGEEGDTDININTSEGDDESDDDEVHIDIDSHKDEDEEDSEEDEYEGDEDEEEEED